MADLNKCFFIGRLTRDPEARTANTGTTIVDMSIAVNSGYGDKEETAFIAVTAFGKTAEFVRDYLKKGSQVMIEARVRHETWEDKKTGEKRSKTKFVAERLQSFGKRDDESQTQQRQAPQATAPTQAPQSFPTQTPPPFPGNAAPSDDRGFEDESLGDIPF